VRDSGEQIELQPVSCRCHLRRVSEMRMAKVWRATVGRMDIPKPHIAKDSCCFLKDDVTKKSFISFSKLSLPWNIRPRETGISKMEVVSAKSQPSLPVIRGRLVLRPD
jgi:hypothetical protein